MPKQSLAHHQMCIPSSTTGNVRLACMFLAEAVRFELTTPVVTGVPGFESGAFSHALPRFQSLRGVALSPFLRKTVVQRLTESISINWSQTRLSIADLLPDQFSVITSKI